MADFLLKIIATMMSEAELSNSRPNVRNCDRRYSMACWCFYVKVLDLQLSFDVLQYI